LLKHADLAIWIPDKTIHHSISLINGYLRPL